MTRNYLICIASFCAALFVACRKDNADVTEKLYVANETHGSVTVIDATTYEVLSFIHLGSDGMMMPHNIQSAPNGSAVWITYNDMDGVSGIMVIDPQTDVISAQRVLGNGWNVAHVVFDSASTFAYVVAGDSDMVVEMNAATLETTRRFALGAGRHPHGMRYCDGKLYVANPSFGSMSIIDVASGTVSEIVCGGMPIQTAVTPDHRYVFMSIYDQKKIFRYEINTADTSSFLLPVGSQGPIQLYPSTDASTIFVCDQGMLMDRPASDQLYGYSVATGELVTQIKVGDGAHGVVSDPDGAHIYVTNRMDNSVSVIDLGGKRVLCTIPVGLDPNGITFWSTTYGQP